MFTNKVILVIAGMLLTYGLHLAGAHIMAWFALLPAMIALMGLAVEKK
jgi:hypothetical protein